MVRFAVMSGSAPLVEAAGCAASSRPRVTVFAPESIISGGDNRPFLLQFQFFGHTGLYKTSVIDSSPVLVKDRY